MIRLLAKSVVRRWRADGRQSPSGTVPSAQGRQPGPSRNVAGRLRALARLVVGQGFVLRAWLLAIGHLVCFAVVYWLAFSVRFDFDVPAREWDLLLQGMPWILGAKGGIFYLLGHYRGWWRYVTFADLVALLRASALSLLCILGINYFVLQVHVPRSVLVLDFVFTVVLLGAFRSSFRIFREHLMPVVKPKDCRWALLVGTDDSSGVLAHQIQAQPDLPYRIRGILATDGNGRQRQLGQIRVLGHVDHVARIVAECQATDVLVTAGVLFGKRLRGLMEACREADLTLNIVPALEERLSGDRHIPIRHIEIKDLLRREPVVLDHQAIGKLIEGRVVLVTGAGGSIGSEICRQAIRFRPKRLVLVGRGENRIFSIDRDLRESLLVRSATGNRREDASGVLPAHGPPASGENVTAISSRIADVTDAVRIGHILEEFRPEVIFHAAAHKHVPLMEDNPGEAVKNNVVGTKIVADLAHALGVECFLLISTDKAVRPTSVMGATKHLAERYVLALGQESKTRFIATRFGNVLGSAGSVVPIFQEQIRRGGPITITDPRMTRFFMTIPEASQLVLQAAAMGRGGEIFVLDMGEPVRIVDLAHDMVRLAGLPENAIEIVYTGIRPGEKLYEELYFDDEQTLATSHPKLRAAYHRPYAPEEVRAQVAELAELVDRPELCVSSKIRHFVPEFAPGCGDCRNCPKYREPHPRAPRRKEKLVAEG